MHIKLINKKLLFNHYKIKCAVGKRGISKKEREGDNITPKGTFAFKSIFYRKDRVKKIKSSIKKTIINVRATFNLFRFISRNNFTKVIILNIFQPV